MYKPARTKQFKKDFKRLMRSGRYDMKKLENTLELLVKNVALPARYENHALKGRLYGSFECHIEPDWLLIYLKIDGIMVLYLMRTGSHSELF